MAEARCNGADEKWAKKRERTQKTASSPRPSPPEEERVSKTLEANRHAQRCRALSRRNAAREML